MEFGAHILKICKIHRKSRIRQTTVLFCKYLANESSDLHEILCGGQLLSCDLKFKFHEDLCINARARVVNARTRGETCVRSFTTRVRAFMHGCT